LQSERCEIFILKKKRYRLLDIAASLGRSVSTVWDELHRNRTRGCYDPVKAHHKAYVRRKYAKYQGMKIVEHDALRKEITTRLLDDQSPEAVAGAVRRNRQLPGISKESIYRFIASVYGRRIEAHQWRKKHRRKGRRATSARLPNRTFIDKRPKHINARKRIGDAEADFIVSGKSGKGILLVVADRKSRMAFIERIIQPNIREVHMAFLRITARFLEMKTLTMDNDILFAKHEELAKLLHVKIFFCHAYHSWEKGTVENTNKIIRRDIPKGSDLSKRSKRFIEALERKLNRRPMKCLAYRTPQEILDAYRRDRNKKRARKRFP
jgi:IS30 family transposase